MTDDLRHLASHLGVIAEYRDMDDELVATSEESIRAIVAAMGVDASTEVHAREALRAFRSWESDRVVEPVRVVRNDDPSARDVRISGPPGSLWELELTLESGESYRTEGRINESGTAVAEIALALPRGYHRISVTNAHREGTQRLIVVPRRCFGIDELLGSGRAFGLTTNLYSLRSDRNWGVGDLTDLGDLLEWAGTIGATFVGVNPLHALTNRGGGISPYSPVSRLYRNPIYIDVDAVPERWRDPNLLSRLRGMELCEELDALRASTMVRYPQVMAVKGLVLDAMHKAFARDSRGTNDPRGVAYEEFLAAQGAPLHVFATWMAIAEWAGTTEWKSWDRALRDPTSHAVARFREEHHERVDYHMWVQFELDQQLGNAAARASVSGLRLGLYQDLAIGAASDGADAWGHPGLFVDGATVGAPPDPYSDVGQDWGFPPLDPRALRESGYEYFRLVLRNAMCHSGALRIDHVMGLFRLFWIPAGGDARHGAYVRYPADDLLGILALESERARAVVVGEDLGLVPDEVRPALGARGVMTSRVFFFERAPERYPRESLATANTHDMSPIAGMIAPDLIRELALPPGAKSTDVRRAVHSAVSSAPSALAAFALDDLTGETDPVNKPGKSLDEYPSWSRKMRMTLTEIVHSDDVRESIPWDSLRSRLSSGA